MKEIDALQKEIAELEATVGSERKLRSHIAAQLREIAKKYGKERRTEICYESAVIEEEPEETVENYPVHLVATREGYFKKITMQSLRGNDEQTVKEGDEVVLREDGETGASFWCSPTSAAAIRRE